MGVKSTIELTREDAENRLIDHLIAQREAYIRKILREHVNTMDDADIEDRLMELNDERAGGEGFENYQIT
jgi:hypothetical protein